MFQIDDECLAILIALFGIVLSDTAIAGPAADLARSPTRTKPMRETRSARRDASHRGFHLPRRNDTRIAADFFLRAGPGRDAGKTAEHDERTGAGRRRANAPRDDDARQAARA
ncbi:hypothetical protein U0E23_05675 [Burkholderia stagnalis]|uniref:hypothetical protein n=1 Tax=Burkholderia stagnalis TaxID=1503054 RepID=UPI002AB5C19D|nr:hypothetical protein [Burkholderia stagnalis]MDY7801966.1 hypothetical protein [Burkholderia stagnalis]